MLSGIFYRSEVVTCLGIVFFFYLGVRVFYFSFVVSSLDFIGGFVIFLGFIFLATDDYIMYAVVKVLYSVLISNVMSDRLM